KMNTKELISNFINLGFKAVTVCIDPRFLDASFCGRILDKDFLDALPSNVDTCGENGEFHTFVYDGPIFSYPIKWAKGDVVKRDSFYFCDLVPS
ncbi:MAG: ATP-binding protein, partial [Nitrososphaeria archaeon]